MIFKIGGFHDEVLLFNTFIQSVKISSTKNQNPAHLLNPVNSDSNVEEISHIENHVQKCDFK